MIFLDAGNFSNFVAGSAFPRSPACHYSMDSKIISGEKADDTFRVTREQLQISPWRWILGVSHVSESA